MEMVSLCTLLFLLCSTASVCKGLRFSSPFIKVTRGCRIANRRMDAQIQQTSIFTYLRADVEEISDGDDSDVLNGVEEVEDDEHLILDTDTDEFVIGEDEEMIDFMREGNAGTAEEVGFNSGSDDHDSMQFLENDDPLTSNYPTVDAEAPPLPFKRWFILVGEVKDADMGTKRSEYWTHHLQWLRRSALLEHLQDEDSLEESLRQPNLRNLDSLNAASSSGQWVVARDDLPTGAGSKVAVRWEYTMLSDDCMSPYAQVVGVRADDVSDVQDYLKHEPLVNVGAVNEWKVYEVDIAEPQGDDDISLCSDMHDPYLLFFFQKKADNEQFSSLLEESEAYHRSIGRRADELRIPDPDEELIYYPSSSTENEHLLYDIDDNGVKFSLLYGHSSRIVLLAQLRSAESSAPDPIGQMLVFNARSRADALRYLSRDPAAGKVKKLFGTSTKNSAKYTATLAAINEQDVDGLYHVIGRNFATHNQLQQFHFLDPEDLLLVTPEDRAGSEEDLSKISELPSHFEMNAIVLDALRKNGISFRYNRFNMQEQLNAKWAQSTYEKSDKFELFNTGMGTFQRKRTKPEVLNYVDALERIESQQSEKEPEPKTDDVSME